MKEILENILKFFLSSKFYGPILYILVGYLLYNFISNLIIKLVKKNKNKNHKKQDTVINLFKNIFKYIIILIVILMSLEIYGINTKNILASLGILTVVVGLAFQDTIKNMLAGILIILDNRYNVGDFVKINDFTGEVINLGLQTTKLKNFDGSIYTITNSNITSVINYTESNTVLYYSINISYDADLNKLEKVLTKLLPKIDKLDNVVGSSKLLGLDSFNSSDITYKLEITCKPYTHFGVKRKVNRLIKDEFDKQNIEIPYNQIDVHMK